MKTLTEITNEEKAVRQRAKRYETAKNALAHAQRSVASVTEKLAQPEPGLQALITMNELAGQIPTNIASDSVGRLIPGGYEVRGVVIALISQALAKVTRRRQKLEENAAACREALVKAEEAMKEFES